MRADQTRETAHDMMCKNIRIADATLPALHDARSADQHLQPEVDSAGLVVGAVVVVVLLVRVYGEAGDNMRCDKVQAPVRLQLLLRAAEQPCQLPWLLRPLEAAADRDIG